MENRNQLNNDSAFYWSVCILRRLRDMGLLTQAEYEKIRDISAEHYGTKLLCV
ncbi:MAG: hypothetical protein PHV32_05970 [Eubacteriales bacterium]|nr:hypothetical protein [Eubacteriales bacterium]